MGLVPLNRLTIICNFQRASVMKLVDLLDSKSCGSNPVPVRFRPEAPISCETINIKSNLASIVCKLSDEYLLFQCIFQILIMNIKFHNLFFSKRHRVFIF